MSVSFTVKIDNAKLNSIIKRLTDMKPDITNQLDRDVAKAGAELTNIMKGNAHVLTGTMRDSIKFSKSGQLKTNVGPTVGYAFYENARGGEHAFFDKSLESYRPKFVSMVRIGVRAVLKKKT